MNKIRFAVPNGSLQERTLGLLRQAGYALPQKINRNNIIGEVGGIIFELRDRNNIASLVAKGVFTAGITGSDLMVEEGLQDSLYGFTMDLPYARKSNQYTKWVLAAERGFRPVEAGTFSAPRLRVGAERVKLANTCLKLVLDDYFDRTSRKPKRFQKKSRLNPIMNALGKGYRVVQIPGKEEQAIKDNLCDLIFLVTETGESLKASNLKIILDNLFVSTPRLLVGKRVGKEHLGTLKGLGLAIKAALQGNEMVSIKFNLPKNKLPIELPCSQSPTICNTENPDWVAGEVLVPRIQAGPVFLKLALLEARASFGQKVEFYIE